MEHTNLEMAAVKTCGVDGQILEVYQQIHGTVRSNITTSATLVSPCKLATSHRLSGKTQPSWAVENLAAK